MREQSNIRLRKTPITKVRTNFINDMIKGMINESFDSIVDTKYTTHNEGDITTYKFQTNRGNEYDLEFIFGTTICNTPITSGYLMDLTKTFQIGGRCRIPTMDVAFVPSEINSVDRDNHGLYTKETNRGEQFELMGRISYLVKEYVKNNPDQNVFIIGKNTKETKLKVYGKMYDNIFSDEFIKIDGWNDGYEDGCLYFIRKLKIK